MPSISQQPATGQQMPPPALIDGVSQQQINQVVREHVAKGRAKPTVSLADYEAQGKLLKDAQTKLFYALDQIQLAESMFRQSSILFRAIEAEAKRLAALKTTVASQLADIMALADLGTRESDCWQDVMGREHKELGGVAA